MIIGCAAFRGEQIIPGFAVLAVALVEVRTFDQLKVGALIDILDRPDELFGDRIKLLQRNTGEQQWPAAVVPGHVDEPFAAIIIVEQAGVETRGIGIDRVGPGALDLIGPDDVIVRVLERAVLALDVGIDQPEFFAIMGEAGGPDATAIGVAAHVELGLAVERTRHKRPVGEVLGVVDLYAWKPFKGRGGDIIIIADAQNGGVRIKAGQNGIGNLRHDGGLCEAKCQHHNHASPSGLSRGLCTCGALVNEGPSGQARG